MKMSEHERRGVCCTPPERVQTAATPVCHGEAALEIVGLSAEELLRKQQRRFLVLASVAVVVCSFFFGVARGLSKHGPTAHASLFEVVSEEPTMPLAAGISATQVGRNVLLNGREASVVNFVSDRPLSEVVSEQAALWRSFGFRAAGGAPGGRGIALAFHPQSGEKYSLVAMRVPNGLSREGERTKGMILFSGGGWVDPSESEGVIAGVPLMPGGRGGAVVSAHDPGGRSKTASYTNPGTVKENLRFYRERLHGVGWQEVHGFSGEERGGEFGSLSLVREGEELTLLFSQTRAGLTDPFNRARGAVKRTSTQAHTGVIVVLGRRGMFGESG